MGFGVEAGEKSALELLEACHSSWRRRTEYGPEYGSTVPVSNIDRKVRRRGAKVSDYFNFGRGV